MEEAKIGRCRMDATRLGRRNDEGVLGADPVRAAKFENGRTLKNESEDELALMRLELDVSLFCGTDRTDLGYTACRIANARFL